MFFAIVTLILIVLVGICVKLIFNFSPKKYHLPAGPPRFPLIGSLISLILTDKRPAVAFEILSKKYGPIFSLKLGSKESVVLSSHSVIMEVANSDHLLSHLGEDDVWVMQRTYNRPIGLFNSFPQFWSETRNFSQKCLRQHGFRAKSKLVGIVVDELAEFCENVKDQMTNGELRLLMNNQFSHLFLNIVWTVVTGKKHSPNDPRTKKQLEGVDLFMRSSTFGGNITSIYPSLTKIFPRLSGFQALQDHYEEWRQIIKDSIAEHRKDGTYNTEPINFLDEFLHKLDTVEGPQDVATSVFTEENMVSTIQDFMVGGTDTQGVLTKLLIRYLLENPMVQFRLQAEVDEVVGRSRLVMEADFPKLVYTEATFNEVLRLGSSVPVVPRRLCNDWKFREYEVPKGSMIMLNVWTANRDPAVWENPTQFDPTRFLSTEGKLVNTEKVLTFGLGKRRCIGELIARTDMILAMVTLIQNFSFHVDPDHGMPPTGDIHGLTRDIVPFNLIIKTRIH